MKKFTSLFTFLLIITLSGCAPENRNISEETPTNETSERSESNAPKKESELPLETISLPDGFQIESFAEGVEGARSLALGDKGTVFVGSKEAGKVYALRDQDDNDQSDGIITIASGLNSPNGVALHDGDLYVAEISRIIKFENIEDRLENPPEPIVIADDLPTDEHHGWKYLRFGPDGLLYVPVGVPCNVCDEGDPYGTILRMNPDGSNREVFARGIRNTVGFDWHPETKEIWFTDNGRDLLGDNTPPDELNSAPTADMNFGFPACHGNGISDPSFGIGKDCNTFTAPKRELGPHVAALGLRFYTGEMFSEEYRQQLFIAEHGSWNRSVPIGYRVMLVKLNGNEVISYEPFAEGWLQNGKSWGRPVDILVLPDGSLLVSDDEADAVYRISSAN